MFISSKKYWLFNSKSHKIKLDVSFGELQMKYVARRCLCNFYTGGAWACGFGLTVFVVLLILIIGCDYSFLKDYILIDAKLDAVDKNALNILLAKNKIVPANEIISHITSFYSNIITIMGVIIGLTGILGYIHLRVLAQDGLEQYKENAKKDAAKEVKNFLEKKEFYDIVKRYASDAMEGTDVDEINKKLADLENKIEELENRGGGIQRDILSGIENSGGDENGDN